MRPGRGYGPTGRALPEPVWRRSAGRLTVGGDRARRRRTRTAHERSRRRRAGPPASRRRRTRRGRARLRADDSPAARRPRARSRRRMCVRQHAVVVLITTALGIDLKVSRIPPAKVSGASRPAVTRRLRLRYSAPMNPARKRTVRLVVVAERRGAARERADLHELRAASPALTPSQLLREGAAGRSYQLTGTVVTGSVRRAGRDARLQRAATAPGRGRHRAGRLHRRRCPTRSATGAR